MLTIKNISVCYGRLIAVRDVSVNVEKGEIVCIVGPNGAGKSTTMSAIAGGVPLMSGSIKLDGEKLNSNKPEDIARMGLSLVPEARHVFNTLSVEENLRVGTYMLKDSSNIESGLKKVLSHFPLLKERRNQAAGKLSGGEQQMLVIARALMTKPRIILIDEPSLGLAPLIIEQVYEILNDLRRTEGLTLLINEQSSERILKFADRIYVLREGAIQLEGTRSELADGVSIQSAYFGFDTDTEHATPQKGIAL